MWEETGVNFFSSQVCLMCAGVNDINNLHLVNTISKPTQNFSIWVLCNRAVQYNVAAFSVLYMHWWERLCRGYIVTGTTSKSPNLVSSFISSSSLVPRPRVAWVRGYSSSDGGRDFRFESRYVQTQLMRKKLRVYPKFGF